jgi:hypothetical protein
MISCSFSLAFLFVTSHSRTLFFESAFLEPVPNLDLLSLELTDSHFFSLCHYSTVKVLPFYGRAVFYHLLILCQGVSQQFCKEFLWFFRSLSSSLFSIALTAGSDFTTFLFLVKRPLDFFLLPCGQGKGSRFDT